LRVVIENAGCKNRVRIFVVNCPAFIYCSCIPELAMFEDRIAVVNIGNASAIIAKETIDERTVLDQRARCVVTNISSNRTLEIAGASDKRRAYCQ
jgi:hypothetical protein